LSKEQYREANSESSIYGRCSVAHNRPELCGRQPLADLHERQVRSPDLAEEEWGARSGLQILFPGNIVQRIETMHWYKFLLFYLWIAPHLLLGVVAVLLFKRRLHTSFPVFVLYAWYEIAEFLLLFTIAVTGLDKGAGYVRAYLVTLTLSTALRFGVIQEIFNNVFHEHGRVDALARVSLRWTTGFLIVGAVMCAIFASGQTSDSLIAGAAWLGRGVAIIQCGLVLFLFLFSGLFGLSLQSYVFGIALGFGILSSVELANWAMHIGDLSESMARALNLLPTGGYHVAVLIWLGYLIAPAREVLLPREVLVGDMDQWNRELDRFLR
jgi:hypothetical protein